MINLKCESRTQPDTSVSYREKISSLHFERAKLFPPFFLNNKKIKGGH